MRVGDAFSLTPAMGWNSWNCFAGGVTAEKVKSAADAIVASGLADHGWSYVNIDDCWQNNQDNPKKKTSGLAARLEAMQKQAEELQKQRMYQQKR